MDLPFTFLTHITKKLKTAVKPATARRAGGAIRRRRALQPLE